MEIKKSNKISIILKPDWEELEKVRDIVENYTREQGLKEDDMNSLQMVSCELVENAIKYGYFEQRKEISMSLQYRGNRVVIEVKNPLHESRLSNLEKLDAQIQFIRGFQNPLEAYIEKLRDVSAKQLKEGESGLGLVRIAYEGQSILDFYVNEDGILSISAVYEN